VGDPSPVTARGVAEGIAIAVRHRLGRDTLAGITVVVQGVGSVGGTLCRILADQGAHLIVTDTDENALDRIRSATGARVVAPGDIFDQDGDVFAPCAAGGVLSHETIARLRMPIVCGAANNQLASADCEAALADRRILYAPDYVVNGGGIISIASEILRIDDKSWVDAKLSRLMQTLDEIFRTSAARNRATGAIADEMAQRRLSGFAG
jgi:leucine dehydrogenase